MKKINICVLAALFLLNGCSDFLDREPLTALSPNNFWKTESDLRLAINQPYTQLLSIRPFNLDVWTADCFADVPNTVSSGTYTAPNDDGYWTNSYNEIRICNQFLENYAKAEVSDNIKNRFAGEARFFRAYYYYALITRFGAVPLITKTLDMNSPEMQSERTPVTDILSLIEEDLTLAEKYLPQKSELPETDRGRLTKGAAQAFAARVYLYYGTWYKFRGEQETAQKYLKLAKEVSGRCIEDGEYSLYKDYRNLFLYPGENSSEHILFYVYDETVSGSYNQRIRKVILDYVQEPTKVLADAFLCKDGLPIGKSAYTVEYLPGGAEFENRDPRMRQTLWKPGDSYQGAPFVPNLSNQTRTGYMFKKYGDEESLNNQTSYIDEIIIRYAEVLLTYAEATFELNDYISDEDLEKSINVLRKRFEDDPDCLPDLTNAFVQANNLDMREEIRRERRVELASESLRYNDLIRWKTAETELPQDILGAKFDQDMYPDVNPEKDLNLNAEGFIVVQPKNTRTFDSEKDYLFPLPLRDISLNPNLKQNPGW